MRVYGTGGGRDLELDLFGTSGPGVVFVHGGGWRRGSRQMLNRLAAETAETGYVTASIDYRLSGEAPWPAALEDVKCAVRWMRTHAAELGVDPDRIAVAGGSAGGHLALLTALTPGRFEGDGGWAGTSSAVSAAILYNPVVDLRWPALDEMTAEFLGETDPAAATPAEYLTQGCPAVWTRVGDDDPLTPAEACVSLHEKLRELGVPESLELVPGKGHGLPVHDHEGCLRMTLTALDLTGPADEATV